MTTIATMYLNDPQPVRLPKYEAAFMSNDYTDYWNISDFHNLQNCLKLNSNNSNNNDTRDKSDKGDSVIFWGAETYMCINMAHVVLCTVVVVIYLSIPSLGKTVHNRAVLRHNVCLLALGCNLSLLGYCQLCVCPMRDNLKIFLWLTLQYFTVSNVFWLNVICFDMTLAITRFRWMFGSGCMTKEEEDRKLRFYGAFAWGGSFVPTLLAALCEYCPGVSDDFILKPNYLRYDMGPNLIVNLYFFLVPLFTLFWNNVLFVYTTYKIIMIQKSTEIATQNQTNALKHKYFIFLRMYLLMGAPWFFGLLLACLNKLAFLKICRLIQPMLWLGMLVFRRELQDKIQEKLCRKTERQCSTINVVELPVSTV